MRKILIATVMTILSLGSVANATNADEWDGLVKTKESVFRNAWVAPDVDFSKYTKIMVASPEFDFREVKKHSRIHRGISSQTEFYIEEKDREKLIEMVTQIFDDELGKAKHFEFVTEPGEDVLVLQGGLVDIVSNTPPEPIGFSDTYVRSVGEATLVLQVSDSTTGELLFRAADRKRIQRAGNDMIHVNRVSTWAEVRRWAKRWAGKLKTDLNSVHA